jgi:hypothetical protein
VNLFEIATAYGARALWRFLLLALAFLALHLLRRVLYGLVCGLTSCMRGLDRAAVARLAADAASARTASAGYAWARGATA